MSVTEEQVLWSVPEAERAGRPLLVLLHGHGMDERMGVAVQHRLPAELVLVSLRGPLRVRAGYGWFPLDASLTLDQIDAAAHEVSTWLGGLAGFASMGILGFSQGSSIATHCLRLEPERFAYGAVLSGFVVPSALPGDPRLAERRPPVFSGRGDADGMIPSFLVSFTDTWLRTHTTLTQKVYRGLGHNVSEAELDDLVAFLERVIRAEGG